MARLLFLTSNLQLPPTVYMVNARREESERRKKRLEDGGQRNKQREEGRGERQKASSQCAHIRVGVPAGLQQGDDGFGEGDADGGT